MANMASVWGTPALYVIEPDKWYLISSKLITSTARAQNQIYIYTRIIATEVLDLAIMFVWVQTTVLYRLDSDWQSA